MSEYYVSATAKPEGRGTKQEPFATVHDAQRAVRNDPKRGIKPITVYLGNGTHYLREPLRLTASDSGAPDAPVRYSAVPGSRPTLSGGCRLSCDWKPHDHKTVKCDLDLRPLARGVPRFSQLFVNGTRMIRARFPNQAQDDQLVHGRGYAATAGPAVDESGRIGFRFYPDEFAGKRWSDPGSAVVHMSHNWGFLQYRVDEVEWESSTVWLSEGGWQINLVGPSGECGNPDFASKLDWLFTDRRFFVENVVEELDACDEWFLDGQTLYFYPPDELSLEGAVVEAPVLESVIAFDGSENEPVEHVHVDSLRFCHTTSTFLSDYEAPSMGDWTIHSGGTVTLRGTRNCSVTNSFFDAVGGNAVFIGGANERVRIADSTFEAAGDSAVCVVGSQKDAHGTRQPYPIDTLVENNYIHDIGTFGKQVAGVFVSSALHTIVRHNLMHSLPRAGICLNDCWGGGHVIEHNEVYDAVRETRDHGPFNSWGREGYWCENQSHEWSDVAHPHPTAMRRIPEQTIIRNNYFHGVQGYVMGDYRQAIDMDDGSTNFHVYNNLCVNSAISFREGDYRLVENNIIVNPVVPFGMHVLFDSNHDDVRCNIIVTHGDLYHMNDAPPTQPWVSVDHNLFFNDNCPWGYIPTITVNQRGADGRKYTLAQWQSLGYDQHSCYADPLFVDSGAGDYRVRLDSPALKLGFTNFAMDFGLLDSFPRLWKEAEKE